MRFQAIWRGSTADRRGRDGRAAARGARRSARARIASTTPSRRAARRRVRPPRGRAVGRSRRRAAALTPAGYRGRARRVAHGRRCSSRLRSFRRRPPGRLALGAALLHPPRRVRRRAPARSRGAHDSSSSIVFLSDFGYRNEWVGICHAVIDRLAPGTAVVDLSHGVPPLDVQAGALVLADSLPFIRHDAVLLAVVDPSVGRDRDIAVETGDGRLLVGPDNGVLAPAWRAAGGAKRASRSRRRSSSNRQPVACRARRARSCRRVSRDRRCARGARRDDRGRDASPPSNRLRGRAGKSPCEVLDLESVRERSAERPRLASRSGGARSPRSSCCRSKAARPRPASSRRTPTSRPRSGGDGGPARLDLGHPRGTRATRPRTSPSVRATSSG